MPPEPRVKLCGLTRLEDALAAAEAGADALGFVFAPSPRRVSPDTVRKIIRELPPLVATVGVFVDEVPEKIQEIRKYCGLDLIQLAGEESEETARLLGPRVIKTLRVGSGPLPDPAAFPEVTLLLDTLSGNLRGGSGRTFNWNLAREIAAKRIIILAGGLTPENVSRAVRKVRPYALDVSSGVEIEPGRKDHDRMRSFIRQAKALGR